MCFSHHRVPYRVRRQAPVIPAASVQYGKVTRSGGSCWRRARSVRTEDWWARPGEWRSTGGGGGGAAVAVVSSATGSQLSQPVPGRFASSRLRPSLALRCPQFTARAVSTYHGARRGAVRLASDRGTKCRRQTAAGGGITRYCYSSGQQITRDRRQRVFRRCAQCVLSTAN